MKPSLADLYCFELHLETAAATILKRAGLPVVSPFVRADAQGNAVQPIPDAHAIVQFDVADTDPATKAFVHVADGSAVDAIEAGWEGDLVITHTVALDDENPPLGEPAGAYARILRQRGLIRGLFLGSQYDQPLGDLLPHYSILSFRLIAPTRGTDQARGLNIATERFRVRFMPQSSAI